MTPGERLRHAASYAHLDNLAEMGGLYQTKPSQTGYSLIRDIIGVIGVFIAAISVVLLVALLLG